MLRVNCRRGYVHPRRLLTRRAIRYVHFMMRILQERCLVIDEIIKPNLSCISYHMFCELINCISLGFLAHVVYPSVLQVRNLQHDSLLGWMTTVCEGVRQGLWETLDFPHPNVFFRKFLIWFNILFTLSLRHKLWFCNSSLK